MPYDVVVHILDDEEPVRKSLGFLVSTAEYAVRLHDKPSSFLKGGPYSPGHCLITDLQMPEMDGVALLKQMRQAGTMMPSVVLTGHGDVRMAVAAMKEGASDFIEKPFSDEVLLEAIRRLVEHVSAEPRREFRRLFVLSYAAMAGCSSAA